MPSAISQSAEYLSFRSSVPQKRVVVDDDSNKYWTMYDAGPKNVRCPLICLPPVSGTGDVYFKQILGLSAKGYRVIGLEYPVHWTIQEFCESFRKLLDHLHLDKIHIFGSSLGGYLGQKFSEYTFRSPRVASLILCNSFTDTEIFQQSAAASSFWLIPGFMLKRMVLSSFNRSLLEPQIADSIDFMVEKLDGMKQQELASRLTLNCVSSYVEPQKLRGLDVTIIDVYDECALSQEVRDDMYKCYPEGRRAHMKNGGNFPYLCASDEVNLHLEIHLRRFLDGRYSARDHSIKDPKPELAVEASTSQGGGDASQTENGES
ncbi:maspardin-like [Diadema setosum]|uniref:maspardin-like n=1 Tax=Diadema setosum TaxID=31175 RepID=UPI003B3AE1D5